MPDGPGSARKFLVELRRRHVFRVAVVYAAVGFLLLQIMDLVLPALLLPDWTYRFVALLLILGFPVALVIAWAFEVTPDGLRRTEPAAVDRPGTARPRSVIAWAALGAAVLFLGTSWLLRQRTPAFEPVSTNGERVGIAVLPFVNMRPDEEQDYFSDGISEELLNVLARIPGLSVTARTSSFAFKGRELTAQQLGDTLGVPYLVEGSVRADGDQLRITAQLIETASGSHVWSDTWDRAYEGIFVVQDEIAAELADQLQITLLGGLPRVEQTDPVAYRLVLRARHLAKRNTFPETRAAEELYRQALEIDPQFSAGWSGLARIYSSAVYLTAQESFDSSLESAETAARKAIAIDSANASAYGTLGRLAEARGDLAGAAHNYQRALELDPDDAFLLSMAAKFLGSLGRLEEEVRVREQLVARDPVSSVQHWGLGAAYRAVGRSSDAIAEFRTVTKMTPEPAGVWIAFGEALLFDGQTEAALDAVRNESSEIWRLIGLAEVYHALGRGDESDEALDQLIERHQLGWAFNIAYVLAYRDEADRAFEWLDRAVANDDPGLAEVLLRPQLAVLREDPRWPAFLRRVGKSPEDLAAIEFHVPSLDSR